MRTLGILLAGGQGKRLGDKSPKALAECAGRTLLERALETLNALCDHTLVVPPAAMTLPVDAAIRIDDPEDDAGPLGGLVTGLAARAFDEAIVLAVDLPLLTHATLSALRALRGDAPAILPAPADVPQPLAAWYTPLALPALASS